MNTTAKIKDRKIASYIESSESPQAHLIVIVVVVLKEKREIKRGNPSC